MYRVLLHVRFSDVCLWDLPASDPSTEHCLADKQRSVA